MGFDPIMMAISNDYTDSKQLAKGTVTAYEVPPGGDSAESPVAPDELIGLKVKTEVNAYRFVSAPTKPENDEDITDILLCIGDDDSYPIITYHNNNGMLDKRALFIELAPEDGYDNNIKTAMYTLCPSFTDVYSGYNLVAYFYESTSDTMGMGLSAEPGWYAVNGTTFAMTPFDIERYPIRIFDDMIADGEVSATEYFYQIAEHEETTTLTLTSENLRMDTEGAVAAWLSLIPNFVQEYIKNLGMNGAIKFAKRQALFQIKNGLIDSGSFGTFTRKPTLYITTIHPIDPKFLPGVCLPVVEFSTTIPFDGTEIELSADDSIKLTKAIESGLPVCVIGALSADGITVPISAVTALMKSGEDTSLSLMFNGMLLQFRRIGTVWTAIFGG